MLYFCHRFDLTLLARNSNGECFLLQCLRPFSPAASSLLSARKHRILSQGSGATMSCSSCGSSCALAKKAAVFGGCQCLCVLRHPGRRQSCVSSDIPEVTWEEVKKICVNVPAFIVLFYQCYRLEHSLSDALKILQENVARYYVQRVSRLVTRKVRTESEEREDSMLVYDLVHQKAILSVSWQAN